MTGKESHCVTNFATFVQKLCFTFPLDVDVIKWKLNLVEWNLLLSFSCRS